MMKKTLFIVLAATTVAFAGCKSKQKAVETAENTTDESTETVSLNDEEDDKNLFLSLERTPCYGECPSYKLNIFTDGDALYEGRLFVEKEGMYIGEVSGKTMKRISSLAEEIGFFEMDDKYVDEYITDVPSTIVTLVIEGKRKTIRSNSFQTPKELINFHNFIDEMTEDANWQKAD